MIPLRGADVHAAPAPDVEHGDDRASTVICPSGSPTEGAAAPVLEQGARVRLVPREHGRAIHDDASWWWDVVEVSDRGLDVVYRDGTSRPPVRCGVGRAKVLEVRI
jgi:hypothetical protein